MRHLYGAYALSDEPNRLNYWARDVPEDALAAASAQGDISADVLVIGGGYTGLNAALHLAKDGVSVCLIDARHPGWGASGRNGGFCCAGGTRAPDKVLTRRFGEGATQEVRDAELAAIDHVASLTERLGVAIDRHSDGETILAHSRSAQKHLRAQQPDLDHAYNTNTQIYDTRQLKTLGMASSHHGGLTLPVGFALHPRKYLSGLARAAASAGVALYGDSLALDVARDGNDFVVTTPQARIKADRLIVATNGYTTEDLIPWLRGRTLPAQSSVIATEPMNAETLNAQGWTSHQMAYEDRRLLHYFHLTPDNRMVFGMRGGLVSSAANEPRIRARVRTDFDRIFPAWAHVPTPYYWSGMVCLTASLTPYCGEIPQMPGAFTAFGYHGNGVAMGSYCGTILADLAQGKPPRHLRPRAFAAPPPRFPLGRYRRGFLAAEYAWARLTD
ncbi:NAD(P)/FAD-dependent oxidoreductase [Primorskyibacter flagellatus]|uniref:NAD(P)/FAD-dependent oxidoreductase n=1 Tax=Primorskyibacter flagellatus TaxID=1387277 RepID=UPI003A8CD563